MNWKLKILWKTVRSNFWSEWKSYFHKKLISQKTNSRSNIDLAYHSAFHRSTTPQNWEDFSRYNKDRAEAEMDASKRLREAIHHTLQQTENDLAAQNTASNYAIRKRIHEFERAIDELNWQKNQVIILACLSCDETLWTVCFSNL